jgi:hypothetical protein
MISQSSPALEIFYCTYHFSNDEITSSRPGAFRLICLGKKAEFASGPLFGVIMPGVEGHRRFVAFDCAFLHIVSSDFLTLLCHWSSFIFAKMVRGNGKDG